MAARLPLHFVCLSMLLLAACSPPPATVSVPTGNAPQAMPGGATFVAPAGWTITAQGPVTALTPPEADGSRMLVVDVRANDAAAAVTSAWQAAGAPPQWPIKAVTEATPAEGWEEVRHFSYEVPANAKRRVAATARRAGQSWTVLLTDFSESLLDKRQSQAAVITGRLWAKGYQRETFAGRKPHPLDAARIAAITELLEEGMRIYGIPGLSFGIVQDGKVVVARGLGVKQLGKPDPTDAQTNYLIASNTKQLTTLLLAKLVEQGKFTWETPVEQLLPGFALGDAATTHRVQVQHLVCACTGLPRQDLEWLVEYADATPASTLRTLATMQPTSDFGALYQYSNPLASAGGYVGAHVLYPKLELGAAYDRAMQELVFDPLKMTHTTFDFRRAFAGNYATPYGADPDGKVAPANLVSNFAIYPLRPAGGAWSNVEDMLRYLQMEIDGGLLPDSMRYISEAALTERRKPKVAMNLDVTYGMGQRVDTSTGVPIVMHGGAMNGYKSSTFFLPEQRVGAVLLTASEQGDELNGPFRRRLLELLFDGTEKAAADLALNGAAWQARWQAERKRLQVPADAAAAAQLADRYVNAALGPIDVSHPGGETVFDFGEWKTGMASRLNDDGSVSFVTTSPGMNGHQFVVAAPLPDGRRRLVKRTEQQEYWFDEVPTVK